MTHPEETEKFIKLNQHLPEFHSAREVEKNGVDLCANQALLLQKIEELTLIIIEQTKGLKGWKIKLKLTNKDKN